MKCRTQFTFYKSFDDVIEDLTDNQLVVFIRTMLDVQFLRIKVEDVIFEDKILNIIWKSQKHSIEKSINGYLSSQKGNVKNPYMGIYAPLQIPFEGVRQQEQVKEQVKEQGKVKEKGSTISNLSEIKKKELVVFMQEHIKQKGIDRIEIDKFIDHWKSTTKNAVKKDWKASFRNWCRSEWVTKDKSNPVSKVLAKY